jgi:hypothetical protein
MAVCSWESPSQPRRGTIFKENATTHTSKCEKAKKSTICNRTANLEVPIRMSDCLEGIEPCECKDKGIDGLVIRSSDD